MPRRFTDADLTGLPGLCPVRPATIVSRLSEDTGAPDASPEGVLESGRMPFRLGTSAFFTPEGYEPNYAYPLVVWFHAAGENEQVLHRIMPAISERNALGLSLRGEQRLRDGGYDWAAIDPLRRADLLREQVGQMRSGHHVHTERIVLAGRGRGAAIAAELFFARPDWFGGLALLDLAPESLPVHLVSNDELAGKPVLLDVPVSQLGRGRDGASRFAAAGLDVTLRHARGADLCPRTLRHLNRWLMSSVCGVPV